MAKKALSTCSYPESSDDTVEARITVVSDRLKAIKKEEAELQQELRNLFTEQEKEALKEFDLAKRRCETVNAEQARMKAELDLEEEEDEESSDVEGSAHDIESVSSESDSEEQIEPPSKYANMISMAISEKEMLLAWEKNARKRADEYESKAAQWREISKVWLEKGDDSEAQWASEEEERALMHAAMSREKQKEHKHKILKLTELIGTLRVVEQ